MWMTDDPDEAARKSTPEQPRLLLELNRLANNNSFFLYNNNQQKTTLFIYLYEETQWPSTSVPQKLGIHSR